MFVLKLSTSSTLWAFSSNVKLSTMVNIINNLQYCQHYQQLSTSSTVSTNRVKCIDAVKRLQDPSCICWLRCSTRCRARKEIARRKFGTKLEKWCHILLTHPSDLSGRCGKHYLQYVMWSGVGCLLPKCRTEGCNENFSRDGQCLRQSTKNTLAYFWHFCFQMQLKQECHHDQHMIDYHIKGKWKS